jgi:hypothetical protein
VERRAHLVAIGTPKALLQIGERPTPEFRRYLFDRPQTTILCENILSADLAPTLAQESFGAIDRNCRSAARQTLEREGFNSAAPIQRPEPRRN